MEPREQDRFILDGVIYLPRTGYGVGDCIHCALANKGQCNNVACDRYEREDHREVYWEIS